MDQLHLIDKPPAWVLLLMGVVVLTCLQRDRLRKAISRPPWAPKAPLNNKAPTPIHPEATYDAITPLANFNLDIEPALKLRPFKQKFHMTMALENTSLSDLIAMDRTYRTRLQIRTQIIEKERYQVLACNPEAVPAVQELYEWLVGTYLPGRFPSLYSITESGTHLRNHVTDASIPLRMANGEEALEMLGVNIDTEFLLLTPSPSPSPSSQTTTQTKYLLTAFINCFPSGFNTRSKLNQLLAAIHTPVPGYAAKLEKSMDRFFANLPVGKIVKRSNWSISTNGELFCLQGNHMSEAELEQKQKTGEEEIDLDKTVVRCERQTLHRLPKSGALVFAFKTYQYPIRELREGGSGHILAEAIDGLSLGSVPGMAIYKRQVIWGDRVKAFLRGEIDT